MSEHDQFKAYISEHALFKVRSHSEREDGINASGMLSSLLQ